VQNNIYCVLGSSFNSTVLSGSIRGGVVIVFCDCVWQIPDKDIDSGIFDIEEDFTYDGLAKKRGRKGGEEGRKGVKKRDIVLKCGCSLSVM